ILFKMKSFSKFFPLGLIAIFSTCFFQAVKSGTCIDTISCVMNVYSGPKGIYSYKSLNTLPASQAEWDQVWMSICDSIQNTTQCLAHNYCQEVPDMPSDIEAANRTVHGFCEMINQSHFRGLWKKESQCITKQMTAVQLITLVQPCYLAYVANKNNGICSALDQLINCTDAVSPQNCGGLSQWINDFSTYIKYQVKYPECIDEKYPNVYSLSYVLGNATSS
ncbi:hypothetical protein RRG08_010616, partial [Elysia crispata]